MARDIATQVTPLDRMPAMHAEYPVPNEPNQLFYIQRSVNSNTVVYAANLDSHGRLNPDTPVNAYWRWYNVDGHKKPLNLIERMIAYGVGSIGHDGPDGRVSFRIVALPEKPLYIDMDTQGRPEALMQFGDRLARIDYVYLQVDNSGMMPDVTGIDVFGFDKGTGKPLREHITPR